MTDREKFNSILGTAIWCPPDVLDFNCYQSQLAKLLAKDCGKTPGCLVPLDWSCANLTKDIAGHFPEMLVSLPKFLEMFCDVPWRASSVTAVLYRWPIRCEDWAQFLVITSIYICLSIFMSVCLSVYLSVYLYPSVSQSVRTTHPQSYAMAFV